MVQLLARALQQENDKPVVRLRADDQVADAIAVQVADGRAVVADSVDGDVERADAVLRLDRAVGVQEEDKDDAVSGIGCADVEIGIAIAIHVRVGDEVRRLAKAGAGKEATHGQAIDDG